MLSESVVAGTKLVDNSRILMKSNHAPPTLAEVAEMQRGIASGGNQDDSSYSSLVIDQLLKETSITDSQMALITKMIDKLNECLLKMTSGPMEKRRWSTLVTHPCLRHNEQIDFQFQAPIDGLIPIGSYSNGTMINTSSKIVVDTCLETPGLFKTHRDYLALRFVVKKILYLVRVKRFLNEIEGWSAKLSNRNNRNPILRVTHANYKGIVVTIRAIHERGIFKSLDRLAPDRLNLRPKKDSSAGGVSSVRMNNLFLEDIYCLSLNEFVQSTLNENGRKALKLVKIWLALRSMNAGFGLIDNFAVSVIAAYTFSHQQLINHTPIQLFRKLMNCFTKLESNEFVLPDWKHLNILWRSSFGIIDRLRKEASTAVQVMTENSRNAAQLLFLTRIPETVHYDVIFEVKICGRQPRSGDYENVEREVLDEMENMFKKGFVNRMSYGCVIDKVRGNHSFRYGFVLNDHSNSVIDKGPLLGEPEAVLEFNQFWGKEKTEVRKFSDGSLLRCVCWSEYNRAFVWRYVIEYLINRYMQNGVQFSFIDDPLINPQETCNQTNIDDANAKFKELINDMESVVDELPIGIASVWSEDPKLRGSYPIDDYPIEVHCRMQDSLKWPKDDQKALLSVKHAILAEFALKMPGHRRIRDGKLLCSYGSRQFLISIEEPTADVPPMERAVQILNDANVTFTTYRAAVELCTRWIAGQFLLAQYPSRGIKYTNKLDCLFVEAICANIYYQPAPFVEPPRTPKVALRRFLFALKSFNYKFPDQMRDIFPAEVLDKSMKALLASVASSLVIGNESILDWNTCDALIKLKSTRDTLPLRRYLIRNYSDFADFMIDPYRNDIIGVVWKKTKKQQSKINKKSGDMNVARLLSSWKVVGSSWIATIEKINYPR